MLGASKTGSGVGRLRSRLGIALALVALLAVVATAQATHLARDSDGHTTLEQIISPSDPDAVAAGEYTTLETEAVDESYVVRDPSGLAEGGRENRRDSLTYISQFTDFQVADEESPARVESLDPQAASAWRPMEAFHPFVVDAMVRQVNRFAEASPVPQADGSGAEMDFSLITGDQADNQQRNETVWIRELLEGNGPLDFGTGSEDPATYSDPEVLGRNGCLALMAQFSGDANAVADEAEGYTGVQDYDDYPGGTGDPSFYDPDDVVGDWADRMWPTYDGLMDHAQTHEFTPEGLEVPFYLTNGNHDALVQGNEDSVRAIEDIALSCQKALGSSADPSAAGLEALLTSPSPTMLVPPDDQRQHVSKPQIKEIYGATDPDDDDHGFGLVDADELAASNGSASYYSWQPAEAPGFRYVSIDTVSEGGVLGPFGPQPTGSSEGNIDDPQWQWLVEELKQAEKAKEKVILFGHHPIRTLTVFNPSDEQAAPCTTDDSHGHDTNPGCDLDPRNSQPLHLGEPDQRPPGDDTETLSELIDRFPNVLAYVSGHTHENDIRPYERGDSAGPWWEIGTAAGADWPQQARLIEVMDNDDGTLSIFATILDPALPATAPDECTTEDCAAAFSTGQVASIGHTIAFNDPQIEGDPREVAEGEPEDRNAELLLADPFASGGGGGGGGGGSVGSCEEPVSGTNGKDRLIGTAKEDGIRGRGGKDKIRGRGAGDCLAGDGGADDVRGQGGDDRVVGGQGRDDLRGNGGDDRIRGGRGSDKIRGGAGQDNLSGNKGRDDVRGSRGRDRLRGGAKPDRVRGGKGGDRINVRGGGRDVVNCGKGRDVVRAGRRDKVRGNCERVLRP